MQHISLTVCQAAILKETVECVMEAALGQTVGAGEDTAPAHVAVKVLKYLAIAKELQAILDKLNGETNV